MAEVIVDARDAALAALLDDATTVPPGRGDLAGALIAHLAHRRGRHTWTLGRFALAPDVIASLPTQLAQATAKVEAAAREQGEVLDAPTPLPLTVVLPRSGVASLPPTLAADVARVASLAEDPGVALQGIDVALLGLDPAVEIELLATAVDQAGLTGRVDIGCEIPLAGRPAGEVVRRLDALAAGRAAGAALTAKLRLAGTMPGGVPSDTELAGFLRACAAVGVPVCATGARHAVRDDGAVADTSATAPAASTSGGGGREHGILNLLGAAVVAHRGGSLGEVRGLLSQPGERIRLGSGALIVGDVVVESELLAAAREALLHRIGCADLDGPLQQLVAMGAVEAPGGQG